MNRLFLLCLLAAVGCRASMSVDMKINGDDAKLPPGIEVTAGDDIEISVAVANTGNASISSINHVVHMNPGEVQLKLVGGDTNRNYVLDANEVWLFKDNVKTSLGEHMVSVSVTGSNVSMQTDTAYYTGKYVPPPPPPVDRVKLFTDAAKKATDDPDRPQTAIALATVCNNIASQVVAGALSGRLNISDSVKAEFVKLLNDKPDQAKNAWNPLRKLLQDWFDKLGQEGKTGSDYASLLFDCANGLQASVN